MWVWVDGVVEKRIYELAVGWMKWWWAKKRSMKYSWPVGRWVLQHSIGHGVEWAHKVAEAKGGIKSSWSVNQRLVGGRQVQVSLGQEEAVSLVGGLAVNSLPSPFPHLFFPPFSNHSSFSGEIQFNWPTAWSWWTVTFTSWSIHHHYGRTEGGREVDHQKYPILKQNIRLKMP